MLDIFYITIVFFTLLAGVTADEVGDGGGEDQSSPSKNKKFDTKLFTGLFKYVSGYLVLGTVEPAGGVKSTSPPANGLVPTQSVEPLPVLTKVLLKRSDILSLEDTLRALRVELNLAPSIGTVTGGVGGQGGELLRCAKRLGEIACSVAVLLIADDTKNILSEVIGIDSSSPSVLIKMTDAKSSNLKSNMKSSEAEKGKERPDSVSGWSCSIPFSDAFIGNFADLFSCNRDIDTLVDNNLCIFLRTILGYKAPFSYKLDGTISLTSMMK